MPSPGSTLRKAIRKSTLQIPGAPHALAAKMIEDAQFDAVYLSGAALSASVLALPDVGLITLTELAQQTSHLTRCVNIPVLVDADTGFGDVVQVERTVAELEQAGAAAIQLEDQHSPKKCGHLSGKQLVDTSAMCAKLRAATMIRCDANLVLLARTDARDVEGIDQAIARSQHYLDAGADWIFPEALKSLHEFEKFADAIDAPLVANMTEFGKSPLLSLKELSELGYAAILYPVTLLRVAMKAVETALAVLSSDGIQSELLDLMQTRQELYDLLDYQSYEPRDRGNFGRLS